MSLKGLVKLEKSMWGWRVVGSLECVKRKLQAPVSQKEKQTDKRRENSDADSFFFLFLLLLSLVKLIPRRRADTQNQFQTSPAPTGCLSLSPLSFSLYVLFGIISLLILWPGDELTSSSGFTALTGMQG